MSELLSQEKALTQFFDHNSNHLNSIVILSDLDGTVLNDKELKQSLFIKFPDMFLRCLKELNELNIPFIPITVRHAQALINPFSHEDLRLLAFQRVMLLNGAMSGFITENNGAFHFEADEEDTFFVNDEKKHEALEIIRDSIKEGKKTRIFIYTKDGGEIIWDPKIKTQEEANELKKHYLNSTKIIINPTFADLDRIFFGDHELKPCMIHLQIDGLHNERESYVMPEQNGKEVNKKHAAARLGKLLSNDRSGFSTTLQNIIAMGNNLIQDSHLDNAGLAVWVMQNEDKFRKYKDLFKGNFGTIRINDYKQIGEFLKLFIKMFREKSENIKF